MEEKSEIFYNEFIKSLNLIPGEVVLIASDMKQIAKECYYETGNFFNPNFFIDELQKAITKQSTILFPTYNWDFCRGITFDYKKTASMTGSLSKYALNRNDFIRTLHPIYSFAAWGKHANKLFEMRNTSSFGADSPFCFLKENNAKMIMIDVNFQNSFTFVHHVEEIEKVRYRFKKDFTANYIDYNGIQSKKTYQMYVRDLDLGVVTDIDPIGKIIQKSKASESFSFREIPIIKINLREVYNIIYFDIKNNQAKNLYRIEKGSEQ